MNIKKLSPERRVNVPESTDAGVAPSVDGGCFTAAAQPPAECPDELYNLTQLAEVSLAAAAGQISWSHFTVNEKTSPIESSTGGIGGSNGVVSEMHTCTDCGKRYSTASNLARHRQTHRSLGDKKARRCPHCDKVYVSMPAFSMHVRTHNQGCKCPYCGKCFSRPWLLQGHIRTHTGEKPFKCSICSKAFADKSNLRAHVQTHSNTKPHVCTRCGKAFALKSYLYKHEESSCMRLHHHQNHLHPPPPTVLQSPKSSPSGESSPTASKPADLASMHPSSPTPAIHHFLHPETSLTSNTVQQQSPPHHIPLPIAV